MIRFRSFVLASVAMCSLAACGDESQKLRAPTAAVKTQAAQSWRRMIPERFVEDVQDKEWRRRSLVPFSDGEQAVWRPEAELPVRIGGYTSANDPEPGADIRRKEDG